MIAKSRDYVVDEVQPLDHDNLPDERRLDFADYDLAAPPLMVVIGLFYPLAPDTDKAKVISDLKYGYAFALERVPIFAGRIKNDAETCRPYALQKKTDAMTFACHHLDGESSTIPSMQQWKYGGYSDEALAASREALFPPGSEPSDLPMGIVIEDGRPMSAAQVNFIRGGLILVGAFHHWQADATSIDMFMGCWADASKAHGEGSSTLPIFHPSFDRTYFTKPAEAPSEDHMQELLKMTKGFVIADNPPNPATPASSDSPTQPPPPPPKVEIISRHLYFSKPNCDRLKELCKPTEQGKYISTYDALVAIMWRAITRSRLPFHPEWITSQQQTALGSAMNLRDRFNIIPKQYIGNGVAVARTDSIPITTLLAQPLSTTASMSQTSLLELTPSHIPALMQVSRYLDRQNKRLELDSNFHLGSDVLASSWAKIKVYEIDFGFGLADGFRALMPPMDGAFACYPRCTRRGNNEGFELSVSLERGCLQRLVHDDELLQYAEFR